jgi:hypothetical protein
MKGKNKINAIMVHEDKINAIMVHEEELIAFKPRYQENK